jgi:hypothetical protein
MKKLSDVIVELEKNANDKEYQCQHGSPASSMTEDIGEGMVAQELRKVIEQLKQVTSL